MPCVRYDQHTMLCFCDLYRLRVEKDGYRKYVYFEWFNHLGPTFYHDKGCTRFYEDWYEDDDVNYAFVEFGKKYHKLLYGREKE
jgi:hypothetical protein